MRVAGATGFWMEDAPAVEALRLRRVPLLAAALCFAAGEVLARRWQPTWLLALAFTALLLSWLAARRWGPRTAPLTALGLCVVVGCWSAQIQPPLAPHRALQRYADGLSRRLRGRVVRVRRLPAQQTDLSAPEQPQPPWRMEPGAWEMESEGDTQGVTSLDLAVESVEEVTPDRAWMQPVAGGARVLVYGVSPALPCGAEVEMPLRLRTPELYRDPGAWSAADQLLSEGVGVTATAKAERMQVREAAAPRSGAGSWALWRCRLFAAQRWAADRLQAYAASPANGRLPRWAQLDREDVAMLSAMLFGDRTQLSQSLKEGFERTGTFHLFVVSGMHVALLAGLLFWALRRLRMPQGASVFVSLACTAGYALLTGFGVPAQRALLMTAIYLLARWWDREVTVLNALGAAALAVMALDPRSLFEASFQMTFLVIVAIAGVAEPLRRRWVLPWERALGQLEVVALDAFLHPRLAQLRVQVRMWGEALGQLCGAWAERLPAWALRAVFWLMNTLLLGLAAEACLSLPMAVYFHRATLLALPLNALLLPLLGVLLGAAVTMFCAALLTPWLAAPPAVLTALLLHAMRVLVRSSQSAAPVDVRFPAPSMAALVVAGLAIAAACVLLRLRARGAVAAGLLAAAVVPLAVFLPATPRLRPGVLEVTALDVGQGDSLLVVSPLGATLLVDAGGPVGRGGAAATPSRWDVGEEVVAPYLWSRQIRRLDAVLLTHAHSDHMGGMPAVLRDFRPRELWLSVQPGEAPELAALLAQARQLGTAVRWMRAGDGFAWAGTQASVLAPEADYANPGTAVNDDSLVMRLDFGRGGVLLEGDAQAASEDTMLANGRLDAATLLKVGHHGSRTSTQPEFLAAVAPHEAVISVGRHNTFGHPRSEVLGRLEAAGVKTFRTDREGAETFLLTSDGGISAVSTASEW